MKENITTIEDATFEKVKITEEEWQAMMEEIFQRMQIIKESLKEQ